MNQKSNSLTPLKVYGSNVVSNQAIDDLFAYLGISELLKNICQINSK